ncbi:hypothetical protein V5O48_009407 [Marasmius crinis-equi]|uniref:CxC2-like cysteine cluster KDZ transposase-associated domain-containing protein n=1 Tax=Marasmius crinis-equi TaxID=585013 RepID=A0ABR3FBT7_9AGAR
MTSRKRSRVSSTYEKHTEDIDGVSASSSTVNVATSPSQWQQDRERFYRMFATLNFESRAHFTAGNSLSMDDLDPSWIDDDDDDDGRGLNSLPLPPGQEGAFHSYEGGNFHSYSGNDTDETLLSALLVTSKRGDMRTRSDRTQKQTESWGEQMPRLVDAYLYWSRHGILSPDASTHKHEWEILCIDFDMWGSYHCWHPMEHDPQTINETLVYFGLIGGSPEFPEVAFSMRMFEIYRQLHRTCPSFSINALARTFQNIHGRPPKAHLEDQLRTAYDAYLEILRRVDSRVNMKLRRDTELICPPCLYITQGEPGLYPRMLIAIDGNNSLKLVDSDHRRGQSRIDRRWLSDFRWLTEERVDEFKDEVKGSEKRKAKAAQKNAATPQPTQTGEPSSPTAAPTDDNSDDIAYLNASESGQITEAVHVCVERWKAAGPESQKRMFAFFAITGVFLAVCRHGHLLVTCDMRRSGELMKYPLAIVNELLERYGKDLGVGYDIMCAFWTTLQQSNKLHAKVAALRMRGVVPAFHGHAHNRKCQIHWHPLYVPGVGNEDFEECERTFALSNRLASTTRLATPFHRQQMILEHFSFHSDDKNTIFGRYCYFKYREALKRLDEKVPLFDELCQQRGITPQQCEELLDQERAYFKQVFSDPPELVARLDHAEKLQKVWKSEHDMKEATEEFKKMERRGRAQYSEEKVKQIERRNYTTFQRWQVLYEDLLVHETHHQFLPRWTSNSPEYVEACAQLAGRHYRRAVDRLEKLVVARFMELTKLNMSGVGYRQRTQIAKALQVRAEAIKTAITAYNKAAASLNPPRESLDWIQIVEMVKLAEFDVLRDTTTSISELIWARPENKEIIGLHYSILRAREEIVRLNVEIKRKVSHMLDEHADFYHAINAARADNDYDLVQELQTRNSTQARLNEYVAEQLLQTSRLRGFTGNLLPGERIGRDPKLTDTAPLPTWATDVLGLYRRHQSSGQPLHAHQHLADQEPDRGIHNVEGDASDSDEDSDENRDGLVTLVENLTVA